MCPQSRRFAVKQTDTPEHSTIPKNRMVTCFANSLQCQQLTGQSQEMETLAASINHANRAAFGYFSLAALGALNENAEFGYSGASKRRFYALQKTSSSKNTPPVL
jgi:hypothetical protein